MCYCVIVPFEVRVSVGHFKNGAKRNGRGKYNECRKALVMNAGTFFNLYVYLFVWFSFGTRGLLSLNPQSRLAGGGNAPESCFSNRYKKQKKEAEEEEEEKEEDEEEKEKEEEPSGCFEVDM